GMEPMTLARYVMERAVRHLLLLLSVLACALATGAHSAGIGWPEAVARLAQERSKAETCVASLKAHGTSEQISRGGFVYGAAKADFDGVIAGLIAVLAEGAKPESLPALDATLKRGAVALGEFCKTVAAVVPVESGRKGVIVDLAKAAIEPVIQALSEAVSSLYNDYRKDTALTRQTIQTQLEATKWPDFAGVKAAQ